MAFHKTESPHILCDEEGFKQLKGLGFEDRVVAIHQLQLNSSHLFGIDVFIGSCPCAKKALQDLVTLSEELGLYDIPPAGGNT